MNSKPLRIGLLMLFVGLLAAPVVYKRIATDPGLTGGDPDRYGFHFEEAAKASGIDFVHQAPQLDPKLAHIMHEVASMGAAVSVADFDRDGWNDFYVTNSRQGSRNALFRNLGNGRFRDVASEVGLADVNQPGTFFI